MKTSQKAGETVVISNYRLMFKHTLVEAAACLTLVLWGPASLSQTPQASSAPAPGRALFTADPRAQVRTYHMDDANVDVPYCVFASSKVTKNRRAPLIVALHGFGAGPQIMCNKTAIDLAEAGGYIYVAPMGYSIAGWYGSPVIRLDARRGPPGSGVSAGSAPTAPPSVAGSGSAAPPSAATAQSSGPSDQDVQKWSEEDVMTVLGKMRAEFNVDSKRIYLTGHSMGGAGTLFLASKHAKLWAAVAPVAPASFKMNDNRADILKGIKDAQLPILIVQGDADRVVAPANTRMWVETMKELALDYKYVELPGIDHGPVITASQEAVY